VLGDGVLGEEEEGVEAVGYEFDLLEDDEVQLAGKESIETLFLLRDLK
jgi:hypothetical protein